MLSIILLLLLSFLLNDFAALSFQAYKSLRVPRGHTSSLHSFQASFDEEWPGCNPINKVIPHSNNDERNRDLKSSLTQRLTDKNDLRLGPQSEKFKSGFVSILGNPNVGKSTLMNRILGQNLCIVSPKPQTTRHRIHGILTADPADTTLGKGQASSASVGGKIPLLDEYTRNGYQLVFSDTPGMLTPSYKLQEAMQSTVRGAAGDADVILLVTDVYGEALVDERIMTKLSMTSRPVIVAINKIDLKPRKASVGTLEEEGLLQHNAVSHTVGGEEDSSEEGYNEDNVDSNSEGDIEDWAEAVKHQQNAEELEGTFDHRRSEYSSRSSSRSSSNSREGGAKRNEQRRQRRAESSGACPVMPLEELRQLWQTRLPNAEIIPISAARDQGMPQLLTALLHHIPSGAPQYYPSDTLTTRDERFFVSEIVRECLLKLYKSEVPYSCEVVIESFTDKGAGLSVIEAAIVASRRSQKAILIGQGGTKIKELGILARERLEEFLGRNVYLSLRVRVDENWRSSDAALARYGYTEPDN